nr:MAG TPA: HEMOGLOBIN TRANSPORT, GASTEROPHILUS INTESTINALIS HEMOGLOBIN [Caudoviricetes sp.]
MRYYSDVCHKLFETQEELQKAEKALAQKNDEEAKKKAERKADADKVQAAYDKVVEDCKDYNKLVNEFVKKYGSYHKTIDAPIKFGDIFDSFWDIISML